MAGGPRRVLRRPASAQRPMRRPAALTHPSLSRLSASASMSAVVTGANKGIGLEISRALLSQGVSVIVTGRNAQRAEAAASQLRREPNGALLLGSVQMDVADSASVTQAAGFVSQLAGGKLDILVNNAGIAYTDDTFGSKEALATVNINALGTMRTSRALLPLLEASRAGRIVNVASIEGDVRQLARPIQQQFLDTSLTDEKIVSLMNDFVAAVASGSHKKNGWKATMYGVSKIGQMGFAAVLARDLSHAQSNVTIASCCPGFCRTDMSDACYGAGLGHKSAAEGADTPTWLALMPPNVARETHGHFFTERKQHTIFPLF